MKIRTAGVVLCPCVALSHSRVTKIESLIVGRKISFLDHSEIVNVFSRIGNRVSKVRELGLPATETERLVACFL